MTHYVYLLVRDELDNLVELVEGIAKMELERGTLVKSRYKVELSRLVGRTYHGDGRADLAGKNRRVYRNRLTGALKRIVKACTARCLQELRYKLGVSAVEELVYIAVL